MIDDKLMFALNYYKQFCICKLELFNEKFRHCWFEPTNQDWIKVFNPKNEKTAVKTLGISIIYSPMFLFSVILI